MLTAFLSWTDSPDRKPLGAEGAFRALAEQELRAITGPSFCTMSN